MIFQKPLLNPATNAGPLEHKTPARAWLQRLGAALVILWSMPMLAALPTGSVILTWIPSPSPDIAGYSILYGAASGVYTSRIYLGNTNSATLSSLGAGTTYYFVVTCYNTAGDESVPSNEAVYTVPANPSGLPVVLGNVVSSAGSFSFTVPGGSGTNFAVEASVDLVNWVRVATSIAPFTFVDNNSRQFEQRFYRTVLLADEAPSNTTSATPLAQVNSPLSVTRHGRMTAPLRKPSKS